MVKTSNLPTDFINFVDKWKSKKGSLVMVLHAVQDYYGYVPKDVCFLLSKELQIPLARIYEVLTFYNYFNLEAPSKYKVSVCMGTACYLKGANEILDIINKYLIDNKAENDKNKLFRLEEVRCYGCCSLAPVVIINEKVYGKMTPDKTIKLLDEYKNKG